MHAFTLHWFRRKQRAVARFVLAAFCLTWLQVAAMPCVMAIGAGAPTVAAAEPMPAMGEMPAGMVMAPGEHCMYCPPEQAPGSTEAAPDLCAFPHDPQVDSRIGFIAGLQAPPTPIAMLVPHVADTTFPSIAEMLPVDRHPFVDETGEPIDRPDLLCGIETIMALMDYEGARALEQRLLSTDALDRKYGAGPAPKP